jgi:hypothetical protein
VGDVLQDVAEPIAFISDVLQQFPVQHPPKLVVGIAISLVLVVGE